MFLNYMLHFLHSDLSMTGYSSLSRELFGFFCYYYYFFNGILILLISVVLKEFLVLLYLKTHA